MGDVTCRCGGKGWRWTGSARVPCTCSAATTPPADPVLTTPAALVPVDRWPAVRAQLLGRRR